jgi:dihydrofolate reductase
LENSRIVAKLVFGMNMSLDGYVDHQAFSPGVGLFRHFIAQTRGLTGSIYGRGLYEVMRYWDGDDWKQHDPARTEELGEFAEAWRRQPKWVVSRTLTSVGPNATLLGAEFEPQIRRLKSDLDGRIDVGGPKLAASLTKLGLIDEYQIYLHPAVLGGGNPYFAGVRPALRLAASDHIGENAVRLSYIPA